MDFCSISNIKVLCVQSNCVKINKNDINCNRVVVQENVFTNVYFCLYVIVKRSDTHVLFIYKCVYVLEPASFALWATSGRR